MTQPYLALITPLSGGGGQIDNTLPGGRPPHVGNRPPGSWDGPVDPGWGQGGGEHPGNRPPGSWGGEHPSTGPIYGGGHPSGQPIVPPQGGTPVPEDEYTPAPPPENIYSQYIVSVWDPKTASWTTKTYPPR
jgi:hypothetical protein